MHRDEELGSLTAFAARPHAFDEGDREAIGLLGRSLAAHLHHAAGFSLASHQSRHDHLTGLQNRRAYETRLEMETSKATRRGQDLALCLLDLDRFKAVNDRFGHVAGDEVLRAVARGFGNRRLHDEAFRIGGDEFAVVFPGCDEAAARAAIRRMVDELDLGDLTARGISFGVSFGIAAGESGPEGPPRRRRRRADRGEAPRPPARRPGVGSRRRRSGKTQCVRRLLPAGIIWCVLADRRRGAGGSTT